MLRSKLTVFTLTVILCVSIVSAAPAEGVLSELWNSGCDLLFRTHNVTVDGEAFFSLDGEHFKTARLHYVQDDYRSLYDWKLFTPTDDEGGEMETGWTIIADEEGEYYLMEVYYPGTYRNGSDNRQNTLLRRSVELDAVADMAGAVVKQLALPEGAVNVTEADGEKTVHIVLTAEQIPDLAASAVNLGAGFLADRWYAYGYDRSKELDDSMDFEGYVTVTEALADGTVRWTLRDADVEFTLDSENRLTGVSGKVCMLSTFWDGVIRAVEVQLNLSVTAYGESGVERFSPAKYNVVRTSEYEIPSEED